MKDLLKGLDPVMYAVLGNTVVPRTPCVGECAGCPCQRKPGFSEEIYCGRYIYPSSKWTGLNSEGKPKTCPAMYKPSMEEILKLNPLKASKRGIKQI